MTLLEQIESVFEVKFDPSLVYESSFYSLTLFDHMLLVEFQMPLSLTNLSFDLHLGRNKQENLKNLKAVQQLILWIEKNYK